MSARKGRQRHHLSLSIGEGDLGARRRETLDEAARRAGSRSLSSWALETLLRAAGDRPQATVAELEERVRRLEERAMLSLPIGGSAR